MVQEEIIGQKEAAERDRQVARGERVG